MSSGKGGKSKQPSAQQMMQMQMQMNEASRPTPVNLQTQGWGGMGYNMPANPMAMGSPATGQGLAAPNWATGDWAMPWWGQQAPNVGAAMMQQQNPQAYAQMQAPPPAPAPAPAAAQAPVRPQMSRRRFGKGPMSADNDGRLGFDPGMYTQWNNG
jgi:hypothetical protein